MLTVGGGVWVADCIVGRVEGENDVCEEVCYEVLPGSAAVVNDNANTAFLLILPPAPR